MTAARLRHAIGLATAFLAVSMALAPAAKAEMPYYDPVAHCTKIAAFGGAMSQTLLQACEQQEQSAYDALKPNWDGLPDAMRAHCDRIASFGGAGSYTLLQACVQQETEAGRSNKTFQFQR